MSTRAGVLQFLARDDKTTTNRTLKTLQRSRMVKWALSANALLLREALSFAHAISATVGLFTLPLWK